jgi:hypothetical protein
LINRLSAGIVCSYISLEITVVIIFGNLYKLVRRLTLVCVISILVQPAAFAASTLVNVKALIYSETAAELQWNRIGGKQVQVSYNGSVVAAFDANSYFTDRLDPSITHRFQLRTLGASGSLSEPVEITFSTDNFSPPIREIRVENSLSAGNASLPALSEVRLLAYSDTAAELFWTRFGSNASNVEVIHNGVSLGSMDKASLFFNGLDSTRTHEFRVRPIREGGVEDEWFNVSVDLQSFSGNIQEITATRVVEQSSVLVPSAPPSQSDTDSLSEPESSELLSEPSSEPVTSPEPEVVTPAMPTSIRPPADDDPVVQPTSSVPILASDCVVRSLSDLRSCVDSAQGIERINIQSNLSCTQSTCCPTGGALLRFNEVANLTIEGNGHKLVRSGGQRQCSLLDITRSRNVVLNNWTLDDDATVAPCVVGDRCPRMLHIRTSSDVTLNEMNILNGKSYVIYVQQVNGFSFLNSSLTNSGVLGLYVGHDSKASTNVRIQNSTFNDNQTNAVALLGVSGSSVTDNIVSNNIFRRNHWRGQWTVAARYGTGFTGGGQMYIAQASGLTVSDNLIEDGYCENCFVQQRMGSGVSGIEIAIPSRNSVTNTLITNNVVNNHDAWGIFVNQGSTLDSSVVISNNQLLNNTVGLKPASTSAFGNTINDR